MPPEPGESGGLHRCHRVICAVCEREEIIPHRLKERAAEHLREVGWKQTMRLSDGGERLWICAAHHEPGSYAVYRDKETDRTELSSAS